MEITYNLDYFFNWYVENPKLYSNTNFSCKVVKIVNNKIMIINVMLPTDVEFSNKAYDLGRCVQQMNGSWNLAVIASI